MVAVIATMDMMRCFLPYENRIDYIKDIQFVYTPRHIDSTRVFGLPHEWSEIDERADDGFVDFAAFGRL